MASSFASAVLRNRPRVLLCSLDLSAPCAGSRRHFRPAPPCRQQEQPQEEQHTAAAGSSSHSTVSPSEFLASVLLERTRTEVDRPSLAVLDELNPHTGSGSSPRRRPPKKRGKKGASAAAQDPQLSETDASEAMLYAHTFERVDEAFKRAQLLALAQEAGLRGISRSKRKEEIVRAILTQRFGLRDPQVLAESERKRRTALLGKDTRTDRVPLREHELFLFAASGQANKLARMRLAPAVGRNDEAAQGEPNIVLSLTGAEGRLAEAKDLIDAFKANITEQTLGLATLHSDSSRIYPILPEHLRAISQTSRCYLESHFDADSGSHTVSIYSFRPSDAEVARELLRQHQYESASALSRPLLTLKSDSPLIREAQFAMLPHVPTYPLSLFHRSSSTDSTFRLREVVDRNAPRAGVGSEGFLDEGQLGGSTIRDGLEDTRSGQSVREPFAWLVGGSTAPEPDPTMEETPAWSFAATFGHALFSNRYARVQAEAPSHIQLLLDPPLPSQWPLAHLTQWTSTADAANSSHPLGADVRTPFFCPAIPPGGMNLRSTGWASSSAAGLQGAEQCVLEEVVRLEWAAGSAGSDWVLQMEWVEEKMRGDGESADVYDGIGRSIGLDNFSSRLTLRSAQWCRDKEADVLSPETPTDLRLSATQSMRAWPELADHPALRMYVDAMNAELAGSSDAPSRPTRTLPPPIPLVHAGRPCAPAELEVPVPGGGGERTLVLRQASRISRTTWTLTDGRGAEEDGWDRAIVEEAIAVDGRDGMLSSLRMEWHPTASRRDGLVERADVGPLWRSVVHQLDVLMKTAYSSMAR